MEKKRRTFWLADTVTAQHRDRALLLNQKGFDIQFFTSLAAVITEIEAKRAGVIVISDDGDEAVITRMLAHLMSMPEVQGARLILVRAGHSQALNFLAACASFRDIIPFDLDEKQWLQRFLFAAGSKPMRLPQPTAQITMNAIAAVTFPARITWVSERRLRIECRVRPPAGSALNLHGSFAAATGIPSITLSVVETQRSHLLYRFSDAIIAEWSVPQAARDKAEAALKEIAAKDPGPRVRIFVAAQSHALRSALLMQFEGPRFEVTTALSKQSITEEPRFFSPDVVFLESVLALEEDGARLATLIANTTEQTTVVIVGPEAGVGELTRRFPGRRVLRMGRLPKSITQSVLSRYLNLNARRLTTEEANAHQIMAENPLSLAEVSFPARLTRLHPSTAQLALPYPVGNFALCRIEAPALRKIVKRNPYGKVSAVYHDTHPDVAVFPHLVDVSLSDLTNDDQRAVAQGLTDYLRLSLSISERETAPVIALKNAAGAEVDARVNAAFARLVPQPPKLVEAPAIVTVQAAAEPAPPTRAPLPTFTEMLKPATADLRETAAEIGDDVYRAVKRGAKSEGLLTILKFVAFLAFALGAVWGATTLVAPHYEKDGSVYSEGLKKLQGRKP